MVNKGVKTLFGGRKLTFGLPVITWQSRFAFFGNGWECGKCKKPFDMYMVEDRTWKEARLTHDDNICLVCLAKRLKRKLTLRDFSGAPVNGPIGFLKGQSNAKTVRSNSGSPH